MLDFLSLYKAMFLVVNFGLRDIDLLVGDRLSTFTWLELKGRWFSACMVADTLGKSALSKNGAYLRTKFIHGIYIHIE